MSARQVAAVWLGLVLVSLSVWALLIGVVYAAIQAVMPFD